MLRRLYRPVVSDSGPTGAGEDHLRRRGGDADGSPDDLSIGKLSSPLLSIPKPGTEDDDRNPPRVAPRTLFDMGAGWDNILHKDRMKTNLSITAVNVTNQYGLYNFLSTFSGTHFVAPRTVSAQVTFNF